MHLRNIDIKFLFLPSLLVLVSALAVPAQAATLFVDGNSGSDGGNDCSNAADPCATIQQAIDSAQAGDTVQIADAVYTEMLTVDKPLAMHGQSRSGTLIQAAAERGIASDRVISVTDDTDFELSDVTIRHGNADPNGGGLECMGGDLLLERVTFTRNDATDSGAALSTADNVVVMNQVTFSENGSNETRQGGAAALGENFVVTDVTLNNVVFENNTARANAGALDLFNSQASFNNVAFIGNSVTAENRAPPQNLWVIPGGFWPDPSRSGTRGSSN